MPTCKEISALCIAQTKVNRPAIRTWLNSIGAEEYVLPDDDAVSDADLVVGLPAKRCYKSFLPGLNPNVTKVRADWAEYLENILKSGHGSVLEHAHWTWAIENVTRVFTAEMNRHRAGVAISEASMRYIRFDKDIPFWMPLSIRPNDADDAVLAEKKTRSRQVFLRAFSRTEVDYSELLEIWSDELQEKSKFRDKKNVTSMMRRIVPIGVCTGAVYTLNMRAVRHVMTMRCAPSAEEEIAYAFSYIATYMCSTEPRLFGDFTKTPEGFYVPKYVKV